MARLRESDFAKVLDVLHAAGEVEGAVAFPGPVLEALHELVPCDVVAFHERSAQADPTLVYVGEPVGPLTADVREARRRLKHEDPLRPTRAPCRLSDLVSLPEFRRSEFYDRVHRPLGIEHMLQLYMDPDATDGRIEFDRHDVDFTERDRRVLELLLPHLRQRLHAARRRSVPGPRAHLLTAREREVLTHLADGRTNSEIAAVLHLSSGTVRKHLENAFEKLGVRTRTAAVAAAFGRPL
jgi:DNA-binding CsgD family transcriptional regulator